MSIFESIGIGLITNFISDGIKKIKSPKKKSEVEKISQRLQLILKLMNEERDEKFTVAAFSKILGLKKVGDLEKYFLDEDEPTFKFLKKFSNEFGISINWLTEGKGSPFKWDQELYIYLDKDMLKKIEQLKPNVIYFVRADSINGETCIVLQISDHRFITLNNYVHFSIQNGGGGERQLVELRKLIMNLILEKNYITKGVIVSYKIFNDLFEGKIFPNTALSKKSASYPYWHDDFTDIYNQRNGYQHHKKYDQNFHDAFNIVKSAIEKDSKI